MGKHNPRSERAMRKALGRLAETNVNVEWLVGGQDYEIYIKKKDEILAIFDLRDCYKKRAPLKGIGKAVAKMVRTRK